MPHTEKADSETVSFHYDMSNEFYADFLGSSMTYTCAVFDNEHMSLEDAQANKLRLILDKLDLQPGQRLLDIGCGWGSMVITAARRGIKVLGAPFPRNRPRTPTNGSPVKGCRIWPKCVCRTTARCLSTTSTVSARSA